MLLISRSDRQMKGQLRTELDAKLTVRPIQILAGWLSNRWQNGRKVLRETCWPSVGPKGWNQRVWPLHVINENISQYSRQVFRPSLAFSKPRMLRFAMIKPKSASPGDHNSIEENSRDVKRDMFTSEKLCLEIMRTVRKQFPVNCLTSASLVFKIQCVRARRKQQMKKIIIIIASVVGLWSLGATYFMILWTGARMKEFKSIFRHFVFSRQVTWKQTNKERVKFNDANFNIYTNLSYIEANVMSPVCLSRVKTLWHPGYINPYLRLEIS